MCVFLAAIPAALAVASAVASAAGAAVTYVGEKQNADAQAKFQKDRMDQTADAANKAYAQTSAQQRAQTAQTLGQTQVQGEQQRAAASNAALESGGNGLSLDSLMQEYNAQQSMREASVDYNFGIAQNQTLATRNDRVAAAQAQPVAQPSLLATGLSIGAGLAGAAGTAYGASVPSSPGGSSGNFVSQRVSGSMGSNSNIYPTAPEGLA